MYRKKRGLFLVLVLACLLPSAAPGQAVFLARKAVGLISRVADQARGHETASVLLEADAAKVFAAAVTTLREKPNLELISLEDTAKTVSFRHAGQAVTLKVVRLHDDIAQILVLSTGPGAQSNTSYVITAILRICRELRVHCEPCTE